MNSEGLRLIYAGFVAVPMLPLLQLLYIQQYSQARWAGFSIHSGNLVKTRYRVRNLAGFAKLASSGELLPSTAVPRGISNGLPLYLKGAARRVALTFGSRDSLAGTENLPACCSKNLTEEGEFNVHPL